MLTPSAERDPSTMEFVNLLYVPMGLVNWVAGLLQASSGWYQVAPAQTEYLFPFLEKREFLQVTLDELVVSGSMLTAYRA